MNAKYADVVKADEALTFLDGLQAGMYDLPKGSVGADRRTSDFQRRSYRWLSVPLMPSPCSLVNGTKGTGAS